MHVLKEGTAACQPAVYHGVKVGMANINLNCDSPAVGWYLEVQACKVTHARQISVPS